MKKTALLLLALLLLVSLAACKKAEPKLTEPIRIMTLNGTTGFGMAGLITETAGSEKPKYSVSVETDAANVTAALVSGSVDIAALPTNAASVLYGKTQGGVRCLALNTRGVLYLLADGEGDFASLSDLEGQTVYVPAQNPSFIFAALCEKAGVSVTVDNTYAQPAELRTALAAGEVSLAVLPEPMVTAACSARESLHVLLDLTAEWDKVFPAGSLVQGCVVVRAAYADEHPDAVRQFLADYAASAALLTDDPDQAAQLIEQAGIFPTAAVAKKALPRCNVCFLTGEEMKAAMSGYLEIMLAQAPASVGGSLPADDFYCMLSPATTAGKG